MREILKLTDVEDVKPRRNIISQNRTIISRQKIRIFSTGPHYGETTRHLAATEYLKKYPNRDHLS